MDEYVYVVINNDELFLFNAFTTYEIALDAVKKKLDDLRDNEEYEDWRDNEENEINVEEGHKIDKKNTDPNVTELYMEKGIFIKIYKLQVKYNSAAIPTLEHLSRDAIKAYHLTPKTDIQKAVLEQQPNGGRKKKRVKGTYKRPKKYISKKKTRKIVKN